MHSNILTTSLALVLLSLTNLVVCTELTFELPDNERMCFYEELKTGTKITLEYQVIQGGNYDIDLEVKDPNGKALYKDVKKSYDSFNWDANVDGVYEFCFSNEFSTVSHKLVYFEFQAGGESPLQPGMDKVHTMTMMETSAVAIHESLRAITDFQTHHRLKESSGRAFAEDLNTRVMIRSAVELAILFVTAITQVLIVRSFFSEKKNRSFT